jgi:hypothetical protein
MGLKAAPAGDRQSPDQRAMVAMVTSPFPASKAGVMVGHVNQRLVIEAHAADGRAGLRDDDDLTQARL